MTASESPRRQTGGQQATARDVTPTLPAGNDVAELLALSDERDLHQRLRFAAWHEGYAAGHADGYRAGRAAEAAERDAAWNRIATPVAKGGPTFAELQRRRYGSQT